MKNNYLVVLAMLVAWLVRSDPAHAQLGLNSPAGVRPVMDMEIYTRNGFLAQQKYRPAATPPATATYLVACASGSNPPITVESGILMDPSGNTGYANNVEYNCGKTISIPASFTSVVIGIELIFESFDLGPMGPSDRDIMGIYSDRHYTGPNAPLLFGTENPGRIVIPGNTVQILFRTENDGIGGSGFRLQWRALYADTSPAPLPLWTSANQLRFDAQTGALFSGKTPEFRGSGFGDYSVSLGLQNMARGVASVAMGQYNITTPGSGANAIAALAVGSENIASGDYSAAIGHDNTASGANSVAMGSRNFATGRYGVAIGYFNSTTEGALGAGYNNSVSGNYGVGIGRSNSVAAPNAVGIGSANSVPSSGTSAMAIGTSLVASGNLSTAMGTKMNTNGQSGAFMIGDADPLNQGTTPVGAPNQFVARFLEGFYLMTCGNNNPGGGFGNVRTGVQIGRGQNSWAANSASTKKERLLSIDHADLLRKINGLRLSTWNYKGQRDIRHYGPMAQDFYAAFGHDGLGQVGCDTLIYSHDFAGVTFAGVQALIKENEQLRTETQRLASLLTDVGERLKLLEQTMLGRKRVTSRRR